MVWETDAANHHHNISPIITGYICTQLKIRLDFKCLATAVVNSYLKCQYREIENTE